jgi:hypothetical protein
MLNKKKSKLKKLVASPCSTDTGESLFRSFDHVLPIIHHHRRLPPEIQMGCVPFGSPHQNRVLHLFQYLPELACSTVSSFLPSFFFLPSLPTFGPGVSELRPGSRDRRNLAPSSERLVVGVIVSYLCMVGLPAICRRAWWRGVCKTDRQIE